MYPTLPRPVIRCQIPNYPVKVARDPQHHIAEHLKASGIDPSRPYEIDYDSNIEFVVCTQEESDTYAGQTVTKVHHARREFLARYNIAPDKVYLSRNLVEFIRQFSIIGGYRHAVSPEVDRIFGIEVIIVEQDNYLSVGIGASV